MLAPDSPAIPTAPPLTLADAARTWARVALLSFGGPAGQIAVIHRLVVEERRWISEARFLRALNFCMLLPGPEAQQLATYVGWLMHGTRGGLVAGLLFVLPGFLAILGLSVLYVTLGDSRIVQGVFFGLKPAVLAVVVAAVLRISRRALRNGAMYGLAALAFVAIFFMDLPFPLVVLGAGLVGYLGSHRRPELFVTAAHGGAPGADGEPPPLVPDAALDRLERPSSRATVRTAALWAAIWLLPVLALLLWLGRDHVLVEEGLFFSRTAMVTFGGAYAVLAYVAQEAVGTYGWIRPEEMLDGLAMAETTPGPLIMVLQFVAFLGAYRAPGALPPLAMAVTGSVVAVWATFAPCFLWIFVGAPYVEWLRRRERLGAALAAVTAAVVGVILSLAVWFGAHVLFGEVRERRVGPLRLLEPVMATVDWWAVGITLAAFALLFGAKRGMVLTFGVCLGLGLLRQGGR